MPGQKQPDSKGEHHLDGTLSSGGGLWGILAGFAVVALLILAVVGYSFWSYGLIEKDLKNIVQEEGKHIQLATSMHSLARQRTIMLYQIVHTEDAFDRDRKIQEFYALGTAFAVARQALLDMSLVETERELLRQQGRLTGLILPSQEKTIELALAGHHTEASHTLLEETAPLQERTLAVVSALVKFNQAEIEQSQRDAMANFSQQRRFLILAGGLSVLLTLTIGWQVWRRQEGLIGRLKTAHQDLAASLHSLENQKRALDEHAIVSIADPSGLITTVNQKFCEISQYSAAELVGKSHGILNSRYHPREFFENMWRTIASGQTWHGKIRNKRKDGGFYWVATTIVPFLDLSGKPYQYVSIRTDITSLIEIDQLLRTERDFSNAAINALPGIFYVISETGQFVKINDAFSQISGFSAEEVLKMSPVDFVPEPERELITNKIQACFSHGSANIQSLFISKSGEYIPYFFQAVSVELGNQRYLVGTGMDMSELKQTEHALIAAKEEAEQASLAKSKFLSSMSHELRTPMNAVLGFAQLMEMDAALPQEHKENVDEVLKAGHHLLELINEVLNLAKIESGNITLSIEPVALASVLNECLSLTRPLAEARGIQINSADFSNIILRADSMRLKQVLLNLLSNAIKYNQPNGRVEISLLSDEGNMARIMVTDTGHGVPEADLGQLFQPFNRLGAESGTIQGSGIGLTISRQLVELMGGAIGAESTAGSGSTFWITLPQERRQPAIQSDSVAETPTAQFSVLYMDDNPVNLKQVSRLLSRRPHISLKTAHTPHIGLDLASKNKFDLILLDINMPDMNGFEVLKQLQAGGFTRNTPVFALTANNTPRDIALGLAAGFTEYLTKPIDMDRFFKVLDSYLADSRRPRKSIEEA